MISGVSKLCEWLSLTFGLFCNTLLSVELEAFTECTDSFSEFRAEGSIILSAFKLLRFCYIFKSCVDICPFFAYTVNKAAVLKQEPGQLEPGLLE